MLKLVYELECRYSMELQDGSDHLWRIYAYRKSDRQGILAAIRIAGWTDIEYFGTHSIYTLPGTTSFIVISKARDLLNFSFGS